TLTCDFHYRCSFDPVLIRHFAQPPLVAEPVRKISFQLRERLVCTFVKHCCLIIATDNSTRSGRPNDKVSIDVAGEPHCHWNASESTHVWITPAYILPITVRTFRRNTLKLIARDPRVFGKRIPVAVNNFGCHCCTP